jgi:hypothetical protein
VAATAGPAVLGHTAISSKAMCASRLGELRGLGCDRRAAADPFSLGITVYFGSLAEANPGVEDTPPGRDGRAACRILHLA